MAYLLQSFATMGSSSGWRGLIGDTATYAKVTFDVLEHLPPPARARQVLNACQDARLRWPKRKASFINAAFERILALGGLHAATHKLFQQAGRDQKMKFLRSFKGIGEKYARNMMMDVYHPDFRSSIAIDARIKNLSKQWGLSFKSYDDHERFYLEVAASAGLNGWELDRLLYRFADDFAVRVR